MQIQRTLNIFELRAISIDQHYSFTVHFHYYLKENKMINYNQK